MIGARMRSFVRRIGAAAGAVLFYVRRASTGNRGESKDRALLRFSEQAEQHFCFLQNKGFRCVRHDPTFVRFESQSLFVNLYHGRKSFELGLELGRLGSSENAFPMWHLLKAAAAPGAEKYLDYVARTPVAVENGLRRLAALFRGHVLEILSDPQLFRILDRQRSDEVERLERDVKLEQVRQALAVAWNSRDFDQVVRLLDPVKCELAPSELKKLQYARKRAQ